MKLLRHQIRAAIGDPDFSRGEDYFRLGKVVSVNVGSGTFIYGEVSGSRRNVYHAEIDLDIDHQGSLRGVDGECSCPVGYNCKHVAALVLAASAESDVPARPSPARRNADLPGEVAGWLSRLGREPDTPANPDPRGDRMFYVIRRAPDGRAEVVPMKAYVKKDGTIGKNVSEYRGAEPNYSRAGAGVDDAMILAQLSYYSTLTWPARQNWPEGQATLDLLRTIVETGRACSGEIRGPRLNWAKPRQVSLVWESGSDGAQRVAARDGAGRPVELLAFPVPVFVDDEAGLIGPAETGLPAGTAARLAAAPPIPAEAAEEVSAQLERLDTGLPRPQVRKITRRTGLKPQAVLTLYSADRKLSRWESIYSLRRRQGVLSERLAYPCARLRVRYPGYDESLVPLEGPEPRIPDGDGLVILERDHAAESGFQARLEEVASRYSGLHPDLRRFPETPPKKLREADVIFPEVQPDGAADEALAFTVGGLPALKSEGWLVEIDPSWPLQIHDGPVEFATGFEPDGNDWFSIRLTLEADGQNLDLTPVVLQIVETVPLEPDGSLAEDFDLTDYLEDQVFYPALPDGTLVPVPGEKLAGFAAAFLEAQGMTGFHLAEAGRARALAEALEGCGAPWQGGEQVRAFAERLARLTDPAEIEPPAALKADLRPYQRTGFGWLSALTESGFGGVLADDMGLGKTVQTLALLAQRHLKDGAGRPSLLIVPTSLIGTWVREAARFAPELKLLVLHGPDRHERFGGIPEAHVAVTTYPLVNRDHDALFGHDWELAILDEAQAVKNPASSVAKHIRAIKARHRLALTGTPMENNLGELWALFDWLIPGLLGDRKAFNKHYRRPIETLGDRARQRLLSTRVKPFLMRRTKDEVAADLPPKTVIDEVVSLPNRQAALYESVRTAMDERVRAAIAAKGLAGSRITVLDALLKLRQVCCDPALVKLDAAAKVRESAKRARLLEMLEELVAEGRRILVFSQFVEMLRLIEADVAARGWDYAMLHGKTKDRAAEIDRFQAGTVPLFLISLKSGGVGLTLTAADTVILYDPWWNPAVERQAMDRAHRIGQDKPVFVHRLFAADTVETAIHAMQIRKQALADALFEGREGGPMALTEDDIATLFQPAGQ